MGCDTLFFRPAFGNASKSCHHEEDFGPICFLLAADYGARPRQTSFRSSRRRIFPDAVRGSFCTK